jgi:Trypsin-co-occurring domain 1
MAEHGGDIVITAWTSEQLPVHIRASVIDALPDAPNGVAGERELAGRPRSVSDALQGISSLAADLKKQVGGLKPARTSIEIGLEFALESGHLVAIIGKATGKSSVKLTLEWANDAAGDGASGKP